MYRERGVEMAYSGLNLGNVKNQNRSSILKLLNDHGPMPRKDLSAQLGLTPASLTTLCGELLAQNILFELGEVQQDRYFLGGDRPSQTAYQKLSLALFFEGSRLEFKLLQSGISTMTPLKLTSKLQCLPPILHNKNPNSISSYSKAQ